EPELESPPQAASAPETPKPKTKPKPISRFIATSSKRAVAYQTIGWCTGCSWPPGRSANVKITVTRWARGSWVGGCCARTAKFPYQNNHEARGCGPLAHPTHRGVAARGSVRQSIELGRGGARSAQNDRGVAEATPRVTQLRR